VIAELPGDRITVGQWNRFETSVVNPNPYNDPYRDVDLNVTYRRPDQSTVDFWGFYDGGDTWRLRFLVEQLGDWSFESAFSDGTPGPRGEFTCVPSSTPGLIHRDEQVPSWFGFKGGAHLQLRCLHVGDRFFAANWDDPRDLTDGCGRSLFLNWLQAQRYNALSIASHYLNRDVEDRGRGWETPALWPPNAGEYQKAELILDELADREICVFPFAGFFGQSAAFPSDPADQELYLRYTLARFGAYWNLLLNVAGPEPDVHPEKFGDQMKHDDVDRLGQAIKRLDVPGHLLSIHQGGGTDRYAEAAWRDYVTLQGWKGKEWDEIYQGMIDNRAAHKPLFAQEVLWPGNVYNKPFTEAEIRRKAFLLTMAAASINYGDMDGKSSTGFSGSMNLDDRHQPWHDLIHEVWDFFAESGVHRYRPAPELVVGGYCLAEPGGGCLVLVLDAGEVAVDLSATAAPLTARWFECGRRVYSDGFRVEGGETVRFVPPTSEDAVLIIEVAEAGLSA
jgi:hypothetical protein